MTSLSPLRYPGGKSKIAPIISRIISENGLNNSLLFEPFCGGAGIGLNLLFTGVIDHLVINDMDFGVASLWRAILDDSEGLIDKIERVKITIDEWKFQKTLADSRDWREAGFSTLFLNRCNRSGILKGGCIGGMKQDGKWKLDARFNKVKLIEKIRKINSYREKILIYNRDILDFWKKIAIPMSELTRTVAYLDPPYWNQGKSLYRKYFTREQHISLAEMLENTNIPFILSYDDVESVKDLYSFAQVGNLSLRYSTNRKRNETEAFILSRNLKILWD